MTRRDFVRSGLFSVSFLALACTAPQPTAAPPAKPSDAAKPSTAPAANPQPSNAAPSAPTAPAKPATGRFVWASDPLPSRSTIPGSASLPQGMQQYWPAFDALTVIDRSGKAQPALAKEWRQVDPTTYEFHLREDVKFHDGTPFEAADVVGTFNYYLNPDSKLNIRTSFLHIDSVQAVDKSTIRFKLKNADPTFVKLLALGMIMPGRGIEKSGIEQFVQKPIGTGPYRWTGTDFANGLKFEAMPPDFVTPSGAAPVKDLEIRFIPEQATKVAGMKTGEIDGAYPIPPELANLLKADGFNVSVDPGSSCARYALDPFEGPTRDVRVRQALNYAVDKAAILKNILQGYGELDGQMLGKEVLGYNPDVQPYPYDVAKAKQLLAEAGHANGFRIPMTGAPGPTDKTICEAVASYLSAVGVTCEITIVESPVRGQMAFGKPEMRKGLFGDVSNWDSTYEPTIVYQPYSSDRTLDTGRRWENVEFDKAYQAAKQEPDDTKRAAFYRQAAKILRDEAIALFLWRTGKTAVFAKDIAWQAGSFADALVGGLKRA